VLHGRLVNSVRRFNCALTLFCSCKGIFFHALVLPLNYYLSSCMDDLS
jgi:hypothetical protein